MSEKRPWILNLNEIDSIEFCADADINVVVRAAYRAYCIDGGASTFSFVEDDCDYISVRLYSKAAIDARERGFEPRIMFSFFRDNITTNAIADWLAEIHLHSPRHHRAIINRRMSFAQMIDAAKLWHESMRRAAEKLRNRAIERDDIGAPTVLELDGEFVGWRWVWLKSDEARDAEGAAMGNCVGGGFYDDLAPDAGVFSLRDPRGEPHVTVEIEPLSLRQAECRGGADVSGRFRPLVDRMAAIIGLRLMIHNDPTVLVDDGAHVVNSVVAGDTTTYYVADGVLHRSGEPARLSERAGIYYEHGVEMRRMMVHSDYAGPIYYACRMIDDLSECLGDDRYYSVGDRYRLETPVDVDGGIIDHRWSGRRNAAATAARIRRVPPAVNVHSPEVRL